MPSPVGHTLAGCCVAAAAARGGAGWPPGALVAALLLAANLPDVDFAGLLLRPLGVALAHQGPTHSLAFVVASGAALALALRGRARFLPAWGWLCAAGATHLFLDYASFDGTLPVGLPLFWPVSGLHLHTPVNLFPGVDRDEVLSLRNVLELLAELAWILPPLALLLRGLPVPCGLESGSPGRWRMPGRDRG